ncbi:MAG TPA: hypothetical protein VFT57_04250 [Gemmatimonadaceae bacterium]|jgi:hypothetical protein|nr:hypothetical protein [Gemmatimonadaceae bacterium]
MRHFHRTHLRPEEALAIADEFFPTIGLTAGSAPAGARTFSGELGTVTLKARPEGGHYTFIDAATDQVGESRLDRNVKRYFVKVHRVADPRHLLKAAY